MSDSTVTIGADLSALRRELGTIPNQMDKEAAKMLANLERAVRKAEKSVKASASGMDKAMQAKMGNIRQGATAVFGGVVNDVDDVGKALVALGPAGGVAAASLLAVGGAALGFVAVTGAVVALVASSDDLIARLDEIGRADVISPAQTAELEAARNGLEAIKDVGSEVALILAAEFAPAVRDATHLLVGLAIEARSALETAAKHADLLSLGLDVLTGGAISQARTAMGLLGVSVDDVTASLSEQGASYIETTSGARDLAAAEKQRDPAKRATGERALSDALRAEAAALRELQAIQAANTPALSEIEALYAQVDAVNAVAAAHKDNAEIQGAAYEALQAIAATGEAQDQERHAAELQRMTDLQTARMEAQAAAEAYVASAEVMAAELVKIRGDAIRAIADIAATSAGDLAGSISDFAGALADSGKLNEKAALAAYKVAKASGLAQVAISTAIAVAKALELGPIFAPLAVGAAIAAGAAQAVAIQSTPPPEFFTGGAPMAARQPDATTAILHRGERVQPAASVRRDDRGDMRASMSGAASPAPVQVQIMYGGRALDTVIASEAERPGSALRKATGTPRLGQRTR